MALDLINRVFCMFNSHPSQMKVPLYIDKLWDHYTRNTTITLNLTQLMNDYNWMQPLFMRKNDTSACDSQILLNVANICAIFNKANEIVFIMPHDQYILSHNQCKSLAEKDFASISMVNANVTNLTIRFKWPLEMPRSNRDRINQYGFTAWNQVFAPGSIAFQCNLVSGADVIQRHREHDTHFDEIHQNAPRVVSLSTTRFTTRGKLKSVRVLAIVEAFLLHMTKHALIFQPILDLVLCFYALHINIRYKLQIKRFLCCPVVTDSWHSVALKSAVCTAFGIQQNVTLIDLRFTHKGKRMNEWNPHTWQETDIFDVETTYSIQHCNAKEVSYLLEH
eukprot:29206_1